jgi:limonene-1,2-epoxide hydrolase
VRTPGVEQLADRVRALFQAWADGNLNDLAAFFAPDLIMTDAARGLRFDLAETMAMLRAFLRRSPRLQIELQTVACAGDQVFTERIDHMVLDGRSIGLPVAAIFTFTGMRISEWREYYDRGALGRAIGESTGGTDAA